MVTLMGLKLQKKPLIPNTKSVPLYRNPLPITLVKKDDRVGAFWPEIYICGAQGQLQTLNLIFDSIIAIASTKDG